MKGIVQIIKINMTSLIFFEYKYFSGEQSEGSELRKWVNINKKRFNEILSTVTKAKNEGLRTNVDGREITLDNTERLRQ